MKYRVDPETGEVIARIGEDGQEYLDPTPIAVPAGFKEPESMQSIIQRLVRTGISEMAAANGAETFEEADDFDVEDELDDPNTPFEMEFDPAFGREVNADMVRRHGKRYYQRNLERMKQTDLEETIERLRGVPGLARYFRDPFPSEASKQASEAPVDPQKSKGAGS